MSTTTFTQLPQELRDRIWSVAAAVQYQQLWFILILQSVLKFMFVNFSIADSLPKSCTTPWAERRRQAFIGYDKLLPDTERQPLRMYVHDSHDRDKMRLGVNEFQTLVDCLPMATGSSEARAHAVNFCGAQVKIMNLFYAIDASDELSDIGDKILEPVFMEPTTVMVTYKNNRKKGPVCFDSAEHLVDVINRVFGNCIERITFNLWFDSYNTLHKIYWPHPVQTLELEDIWLMKLTRFDIFARRLVQLASFIHDQSHDQPTVFMTLERALHVAEEFYDENWFEMRQAFLHLLKFREVLDASTKKLPWLRNIELELHTHSWDEVLLTRIKATNKDGILLVNWRDVHIDFEHNFVTDAGDG